jgi:hypothetical protein
LTADKITNSNSANFVRQTVNLVIGQVYTASFYIKNIDATQSILFIRGTSSNLNLVITWSGNDISSTNVGTFESVGGGWYRVQSTFTALEASALYRLYNVNTTESSFIWGAQLVEGTSALDYQMTETRLNIPRLDYSLGSCPNILLEPQRTNLALRSEEFENASWLKTAVSITANSAISPSGVQNADTLTGDGTSTIHNTRQSNSVTNGVAYTFSCYVKKNTNDFIQLIYNSGFGGNAFANFNLNSGVVGTVGAGTTASISSFGNGWYRCSITAIATSTITANIPTLCLVNSASSPIFETNTLTTSVFLWGAQLEAGAYATSYIPTSSASVTRNADVISKTGIADLIGQTEGTIFIETRPLQSLISDGVNRALFSLNQDSLGLNLFYLRRVNNTYFLSVISSGTSVANPTVFTYSNINLNKLKIAIKYGLNTLKVFVNGVNTVNQTISSVPTTNTLTLGSNRLNGDILEGRIDSFQLYKTALTDTQCIALTTL